GGRGLPQHCRVWPGSPARPGPCARSATHAAIWLRELKPSLFMMLATCLGAVVWLMDSSAAMALLDRPPATSSAISYSGWVSELGGAAATRERRNNGSRGITTRRA